MQHRKRLLRAGACAAVVGSLLSAPAASAQLDEVNTSRLRQGVTVNGILAHERAFQAIANANGGTRASGTPGYDASVAYVRSRLEAAGYQVTEQEFTFPFFRELAPPVFAQVSPTATTYEPTTMTYSGSGDVTGPLLAVNDIEIPPGPLPTSSTAGCEASDFPAAPAEPAVILIQRGTCTFEVKAANAVAAGYEAVVIFNEGQEGRTGPLAGTLGRPFDIPVVGVDFATGSALYSAVQAGPVRVRVATSTEADLERPTKNLIAQTASGDASQAVVVGAHLDSVAAGPGINDNGSGSATILEVAEEMAELAIQPRRQVRFAFWGAEELALHGSRAYVRGLDAAARRAHVAYLNLDMVGSPRPRPGVYAASADPVERRLEARLRRALAHRGVRPREERLGGASDHAPFARAGIPVGGLFTGSAPAQDPCYHRACDTLRNVDAGMTATMASAARAALLALVVNGS